MTAQAAPDATEAKVAKEAKAKRAIRDQTPRQRTRIPSKESVDCISKASAKRVIRVH